MKRIAQTLATLLLGASLSIGFSGCDKQVSESLPKREYIVENAEILEFKSDLDYLVLREKTSPNKSFKLKYADVEEFNSPNKDLGLIFKRPFALVKEYDNKTTAEIYPLEGISPRKFVR